MKIGGETVYKFAIQIANKKINEYLLYIDRRIESLSDSMPVYYKRGWFSYTTFIIPLKNVEIYFDINYVEDQKNYCMKNVNLYIQTLQLPVVWYELANNRLVIVWYYLTVNVIFF